MEEIGASNLDVVLSAEGLSCAIYNEERFRSFIRRLKQLTPRVVVIAYVRNQIDYAPSLYLILLQFGYRETFDTFLDAGLRDGFFSFDTLRFPFCFRGLLKRFPAKVETVIRHFNSVKGSIVSDFLSALGLDPTGLGADLEVHENPSIGLGDAFLLFYGNRKGHPPGGSGAWLTLAIRGAGNAFRGDLAASTRQRIIAQFDDSNRFMNSRFEQCSLATLDQESPDLRPDGRIHIEHLFSDAMIDFVGKIVETAEASR